MTGFGLISKKKVVVVVFNFFPPNFSNSKFLKRLKNKSLIAQYRAIDL